MCTRVFDNRFDHVSVVGRTLDCEVSDEARLWYFPEGHARSGGCDNSLTWDVAHRNLATSMWGVGTTEGMNEAGLSAHLLYLAASDFGSRDDRPGVSLLLWAQYVLDSFASVVEALDHLDDVQIVQRPARGQILGAHLSLEDASGDSAIVEMLTGQPTVHHGREFRIMANDPTFDEQLASLGRYAPFGGSDNLPGDIMSDQRFARATYFLEHLSQPQDAREAVAGVMSITRNACVPFGAPYGDFTVYPTWWASVMDLQARTYFHQSTLAPNVVWATIPGPEVDEVLCVDPAGLELSGNITQRLAPCASPY